MSRFYGTVRGQARTTATRRGGPGGLTTHAAGWRGAVRATVENRDGRDWFTVSLVPWKGSGGAERELVAGWLDAAALQEFYVEANKAT